MEKDRKKREKIQYAPHLQTGSFSFQKAFYSVHVIHSLSLLLVFGHRACCGHPGSGETLVTAFRLKEVDELTLDSLLTGSLKVALQPSGPALAVISVKHFSREPRWPVRETHQHR